MIAKKVCAVLVTYNRVETLKQALARILAQSLLPTIVIVDNNSNDGTREYISDMAKDHDIYCVFLDTNSGASGGIAAGMRKSLEIGGFDYVWILDDDTFYDTGALQQLVTSIENSGYSMLGQTGFHIRSGNKKKVVATNCLQDVDYTLIDGAVIKSDVVRQLGVTREEFFMMGEDHEYCLRLKKHGFRIGLIEIADTERLYMGGAGAFTKSTLWRGYYSSRNHMTIVKQYFSFINLFAYFVRQSKFLVAAAIFAPDRFKRVRFRALGIWHGIRGINGKTLDPVTLKFKNVKQNGAC